MKLANVQALRGLAALAVVAAHIGDPNGFETTWLAGGRDWFAPLHDAGQAGVDLFFVISGLIMVVTTSRVAPGPAGSRSFLARRARRIYPVYWLATLPALVLFVTVPSMVNSSSAHPPRILESLLLLPQPGLPLLLVGWTLTFELYFYLVFALTLLARPRLRLPLLAGWGAVTTALALLLPSTGNPWLAVLSAPICLEFLFGAVVGSLVVSRRVPAPEAFTATGAIGVGLALTLGGHEFPGTWYRAVPVGALIAVLVYGVIGLETRGRRPAPAWLQRIGDASYSIYLWHVLILTGLGRVLLVRLPGNPLVHAMALVFSIGAVLAGSLLAYRLVEQPLTRALRDRTAGRSRRRPVARAAAHKAPARRAAVPAPRREAPAVRASDAPQRQTAQTAPAFSLRGRHIAAG